MLLQSLVDKACSFLSSIGRSHGAPESDEEASEEFLARLASEFSAGKSLKPEAGNLVPASNVVTVDDEGFDCRIGKRARKRRREARKTVDSKSKLNEAKTGGKLQQLIDLSCGCNFL